MHRRNDTNEVFYVGSGINKRFKTKSSRNKQWLSIVNDFGFTPEIILSDLSRQEAHEIESLLIEMHTNLVNVHIDNTAYDLNVQYNFLDGVLKVDTSSPTGLSYKVNRYKNKGAISKIAGEVAGKIAYLPNKLPRGYMVKITFPDGVKRELQCHRVVWLLTYGSIDSNLVIDHIDGNPLNNLLSNLQLVSHKQNTRNRKPKNEGIPGVYIKQGLQWVADMCLDNGTRELKGFSIKKYGNDKAKEMAIQVRREFLARMNETSEPYTTRHTLLELE